jgi:nicotinamidase-related amidase
MNRKATKSPSPLTKQRTALVVIDMQDRFRGIIQDGEQVIAACSRLVRFCLTLEIPVVVTEHYPRGLGTTMAELQQLFPSWAPLEKITFSCCGDDGFTAAIGGLRRDQIVLCGIESHVCVYQTARDLLSQGHQVATANDAISARSATDREIGLRRMAELGAQTMSAEMIMFEVLQRAKTQDFKAVADILRE